MRLHLSGKIKIDHSFLENLSVFKPTAIDLETFCDLLLHADKMGFENSFV